MGGNILRDHIHRQVRMSPAYFHFSQIYFLTVAVNHTIAIDLSKSWKTSSIPYKITNTTSSFPTARKPSIWYDENSDLVYSFGGSPYSNIANIATVWAFKPDGNGNALWQTVVHETDSVWNTISWAFGALTATSNDSFYSLGGIRPPDSLTFGAPTFAYPGMAIFDFQLNQWKNASSADYKPQGYGILGQAEFIPIFGKKGIIIFVGGNAPTIPFWPYSRGSSLADMTTVNVFDIDSDNWLQQKTTGDIPHGRYAFCMAGAGENGSGSYEL